MLIVIPMKGVLVADGSVGFDIDNWAWEDEAKEEIDIIGVGL